MARVVDKKTAKQKSKTIILIDTNFLLIPAQFGVDIFSEIDRLCHVPYELRVYAGTILELEKIARTASGRDKAAARLGRQLLSAKKVKIIKPRPAAIETLLNTDRFIVDFAARNKCIVATLDRELQKVLLEKGIRCIVLRGKDHLEMRG